MADPITAIAVIGLVTSTVGVIQQGRAAQKTADFNAAVNTNNARAEQLRAAADASRSRRLSRKAIGSLKAQRGAQGITLEGSFEDVLSESVANAEADALNIEFGGQAQSQGFLDSASLDRAEGRSARRATTFTGAANLLSGGSTIYANKLTRT